jgi:hypothetical protein
LFLPQPIRASCLLSVSRHELMEPRERKWLAQGLHFRGLSKARGLPSLDLAVIKIKMPHWRKFPVYTEIESENYFHVPAIQLWQPSQPFLFHLFFIFSHYFEANPSHFKSSLTVFQHVSKKVTNCFERAMITS